MQYGTTIYEAVRNFTNKTRTKYRKAGRTHATIRKADAEEEFVAFLAELVELIHQNNEAFAHAVVVAPAVKQLSILADEALDNTSLRPFEQELLSWAYTRAINVVTGTPEEAIYPTWLTEQPKHKLTRGEEIATKVFICCAMFALGAASFLVASGM